MLDRFSGQKLTFLVIILSMISFRGKWKLKFNLKEEGEAVEFKNMSLPPLVYV